MEENRFQLLAQKKNPLRKGYTIFVGRGNSRRLMHQIFISDKNYNCGLELKSSFFASFEQRPGIYFWSTAREHSHRIMRI